MAPSKHPATGMEADRCDYRPILTPKTVLPLFFAIGIIFAPIGGGLLYASAQVSRQIHFGLLGTQYREADILPMK